MNKSILCIIFLIATLFSSSIPYATATDNPRSSWAIQALAKKSNGTLRVEWNENTNTPSLITGALSRPSKHSPSWITYEFLKQVKSSYGIRNPNRDIKVIEVERGHDLIKVRTQHVLFGTPVWGDWLDVSMDHKGVIRRVEGTIHPKLEKQLFNRPMQPAFSKKKAIKKAKDGFQGKLAAEPKVNMYYLTSLPGTPLIYVVELQYHSPNRTTSTMIHSLSGRIIKQSIQ